MIEVPKDPYRDQHVMEALKKEVIVLLKMSQGCCHHVCKYFGIALKETKFFIVMKLYSCSLDAYIGAQPGELFSL